MNIRKPWKQTPSYKGEEKAESYNFFRYLFLLPFRYAPECFGRIVRPDLFRSGFRGSFHVFPTAPPHASGSSICTT